MGTVIEEDVAKKLKGFMASDGTFRSSVGSKGSSIKNTFLALQVLASQLNDIKPAVLDTFVDAVLPLLPRGNDATPVDPTLLSLLSKISSKKPKLIGPRLDAVTESLLQLRYSDNLETLAGLLESLNVVTTYKASPVCVTFRTSSMGSEDLSKSLILDVVDVFGNPVTPDSIVVQSIKRSGRDTVLFQGPVEGNSLDLTSVEGIVPGLFAAEIAVKLPGQTTSITKTLAFAIHGQLEVVNVSAGVNALKQVSVSDLSPVASQNSLQEMSASAAKGEIVHLSFGLSSPTKAGERFQKPHQVFVKFTNEATGLSSAFVGQADGKLGDASGSKYRATVSLSKELETFKHVSGTYKISLLVSDVAYGLPTEWVVGSIDLTFPAKVIKDSPLYTKPLMFTSDNTLEALPEIQHVMRPESKRASIFMSTIFTALTTAPLVLFIGFILFLSPNLKRLQSVTSLIFVICLLVTLFLYAGYWLALEGVSFYDTIKYLCFLAPLTIIVGSSAVSSVAETRTRDSAKNL
jgi:Oligosaccharyltransferase subunit Ribophorin II